MYALMSRKTQALHAAVFEKVKELASPFAPLQAMIDFDDAP